ncbi:MAG: SurA N-terminal domain-containing protein, partial [Chloroflexi bacterium]|nr:SurA N-terminal domain-containing protein [Chloroflexota bacterium]
MSKRRIKIPTPTWEHEQTGITRKLEANRWQLWATAAIVLLVVASLGVIGWAYLSDYIGDQQRPGSLGLRVADRELTVEEYSQRASLFAEDSGVTIATSVIPALNAALIEEAIMLQFADELSVTASDDEVRDEIALLLGIESDDANFDSRLEEELTRTGLSEEEFTDLARATVLVAAARDSFTSEVAESLPSVNYRQIRVVD